MPAEGELLGWATGFALLDGPARAWAASIGKAPFPDTAAAAPPTAHRTASPAATPIAAFPAVLKALRLVISRPSTDSARIGLSSSGLLESSRRLFCCMTIASPSRLLGVFQDSVNISSRFGKYLFKIDRVTWAAAPGRDWTGSRLMAVIT